LRFAKVLMYFCDQCPCPSSEHLFGHAERISGKHTNPIVPIVTFMSNQSNTDTTHTYPRHRSTLCFEQNLLRIRVPPAANAQAHADSLTNLRSDNTPEIGSLLPLHKRLKYVKASDEVNATLASFRSGIEHTELL